MAIALTIRPLVADDAVAALTLHYNAVHQTAAHFYSQAVRDVWSPPINEARIKKFQDYGLNEIRISACDTQNKVLGFGGIRPQRNEICACYVDPVANGQGVGRAIMQRLEHIAFGLGFRDLELDSSLNAEEFYKKCGYTILRAYRRRLHDIIDIDCLRMHKQLNNFTGADAP